MSGHPGEVLNPAEVRPCPTTGWLPHLCANPRDVV
nr:MAG TPA: zinc finger protein [Caudoviricetes sp.]